MEKLTWEKVYQLPLMKSDGLNNYYSTNHTMALSFCNLNEAEMKRIVAAINGGYSYKVKGLCHDGCDFFLGGELKLIVRGWGRLTGVGGYNLSEDEAIEIQNGFINYIVSKLI